MEAVLGLFVMLLGVFHGVETSCNGRQNGTKCYGALGGTVVIQLMDNASGIARFEWKKEKTLVILKMTNNSTIYDSVIQNRSFFTPSNGTLRINNLIGNDSGEYTLEIFNENGKQTEQRTLQLTVQEPHTVPIVAGVLSALVIFLVIGVAVICTQKKKKNHKPKEEENEHELTYADVKIVQRQERQVKQRAEKEVEYGQVKISERPQRAAEPKGDDCVYAKVCRVR